MKDRFSTIFCVFITIFGLNLVASAQEVSIPDPNLAAAVRKAFSLPPEEPITQQLMLELTNLSAPRAQISDLTGLEHARNLMNLNLDRNQISDIGPLAGLTELEILSLASNQISDISALAELTQLRTLSIGSNQIGDISALSDLTALTNLFLVSNQIGDITPLMALTQLEQLSLWDNQISDLNALAGLTQLEALYLVSNEINDIKSLSGLTNLLELWLDDNQISDLSPLSGLTQLEDLSLGSNQISILKSLSSLTQLGSLSLESNQIRIVTPLKNLTELESLYLNSNQISSIRPLRELPNLEELYIADNPISDTFQIHQMIAAGVDIDFETSVPNESQVALTRVLFNEIRNASNDRNDWIELKNISNSDISLSEWEISILTREGGTVNSEVDIVSFPDYTLPADGILLITNADPRTTPLLKGHNIKTPDVKEGAQHHYLVSEKLNLPDTPYLLILRSARDKNGTPEAIEDVAGTYFLDTFSPEFPLTEGTAWQRALISKLGYDVDAWKTEGYQAGVGYQPTALKDTSHGTPGYSNDALVSQSSMGQISISEVMFANRVRNRSVPQWIELYNNSHTEAVNLTGWELKIEARQGKQNKYAALKFTELHVLPNQTVLLVTGTTQNTANIPDKRIYNFTEHHLLDILFKLGNTNVLGPDGFFLSVSTPDGTLVDTVGNLDGDSETQDAPAWELPSGTSQDGARSSLLRRYHVATRMPLTGTDVKSWRSATEAMLGKSTYWGDATDVSNPGYMLGGVLPVTLSGFRAERTETGVLIKWTTESELNNAGFNILRSQTRNGTFKGINSTLIQGAGTTGERQTYRWTDTTAKPNVTYYYRLEDISFSGVRTRLSTVRIRGDVAASGKLLYRWGRLKM